MDEQPLGDAAYLGGRGVRPAQRAGVPVQALRLARRARRHDRRAGGERPVEVDGKAVVATPRQPDAPCERLFQVTELGVDGAYYFYDRDPTQVATISLTRRRTDPDQRRNGNRAGAVQPDAERDPAARARDGERRVQQVRRRPGLGGRRGTVSKAGSVALGTQYTW